MYLNYFFRAELVMKNLVMGVFALLASVSVNALVIDFEDLDSGLNNEVYEGIFWGGFGTVDTQSSDLGYQQLSSSDRAAFSLANSVSSRFNFSDGSAFSFNQATFVSARHDNLEITVQALKADRSAFIRETFTVNTGEATTVDFSFFTDVVSISITRRGGTLVEEFAQDGNARQFAIDNLVFNEDISAVPLPASMWMFAVGLLGFGYFKKRNSKKK